MYVITDYYLMYGRYYSNKAKRVEPVDPPGDPAYQEPESERQKGKRDLHRKAKKAKKFSGKNLVNIWV